MNLTRASIIARELMNKHGLEDWKLQIGWSKKDAGSCVNKSKLIRISRYFIEVTGKKHFINVVLHEIAHALEDTYPQHSEEWRQKFIEIGGDGVIYVDNPKEWRNL
jgi:predicted SprT family Zn-dependent metalloprotease